MDGGMCAYEVVEFSTDTCQDEEVIDGEVSYDENEDVRWQGEEEEHDPESRVGAHILIISAYRPDAIRVADSQFLARDSLRPSAVLQLYIPREHAQRCAHIVSR